MKHTLKYGQFICVGWTYYEVVDELESGGFIVVEYVGGRHYYTAGIGCPLQRLNTWSAMAKAA